MKRLSLYIAVALIGVMSLGMMANAQTIGISIPAATHGWTAGVNYWAEVTVNKLKERYPQLDFVLLAAANEVVQNNDLEDLYAIYDIDALVVLPESPEAAVASIQHLKNLGVFITVVDRALPVEGIEDIYVGGNNYHMGYVSCEFIAQKLGGQGKIVITRGMPIPIDQMRFDGCMDALEGTNIEVIDWQYANFNRDDGYRVMQDFLIAHDHIDAVWGTDDDQVIGIIAAIEQAGRQNEMFVVGGAGMKEIVQMVMAGDDLVVADVTYPPSQIGTGIEVTVLALLTDLPFLGEYVLDSELITPENAADFYFPDSPF